MSSALALASVTAVLKDLLENGLASAQITSIIGGDSTVSAVAPDRITAGADEKAQLNIFFYLATPNTALRTVGAASRSLALDLHYLITAYGGQDYHAEILLGHAIRLLHETPVLEPDRIRKILTTISQAKDRRAVPPVLAALGESGVTDAPQRLLIEPTFLNAEEMAKLWSALQAKFRPSMTYRISAVFLDGPAGP